MKIRFPQTISLLVCFLMEVPSTPAFDFDGYTDILWQNTVTGDIATWSMDLTKFNSAAFVSERLPDGWEVVGSGDFNRDGQTDLLVRSETTGANEIWLMNETNRISQHAVTPAKGDFKLTAVGDVNGDGYPDLIWRDSTHNLTAAWYMQGILFTGQVGWISGNSRFNWNLVACADFDNDSHVDLLWRDRYSGANFIWLMNGVNWVRTVEIPPQADLRNRLASVGEFNLMGNTDLVWRHTSGRNEVWFMNGTSFQGSAALPTVDMAEWRIAGAGGYTNEMALSAASNDRYTELNLHWKYGKRGTSTIRRRQFGTSDWELLATNHVPSRFTDRTAQFGLKYEYQINGGYLLSAIAAHGVEERGTIILVVDETVAPALEADLALLKSDLVGDGWTVVRTDVPRHNDNSWQANLAPIASIKSFITNTYTRDPAATKAVYLIGHVPIPYSGFCNPDGHGARGLPADVYYGDVDGIYTDSIVHSFSRLEGPRDPRHDNIIGDGKFDQSKIPMNEAGDELLELAVGRVDFANLPSFSPKTEIDLIRQYLNKTHRFRHNEFSFPQTVAVDTFFTTGPNRDAYGQAVNLSSRLFGTNPGFLKKCDPLRPENAATWGIICGYGLPSALSYSTYSYHQSVDFSVTNRAPHLAVASFFGSYFVDHAYRDNLMRSFLGSPNSCLAATWFKPVSIDRIALGFESCGLGEPLGTGFVRMINESQRNGRQNIFEALLGDPTLRLQVQPPAGQPRFSASGESLEWQASADTNAYYMVYRSGAGLDGPWERVTPTPTRATSLTGLTSLLLPGTYEVRAVGLAKTGSGSFIKMSQGVFVERPVIAESTPVGSE